MNRILSLPLRFARAVGREIVATIKFGAVATAAAPRGRTGRSNAAGVVAGLTQMQERDEESD
jgi:hypothetical protein